MAHFTRVLSLRAIVLAAGISAAAAQKETITWNDAPPKSAATSNSSNSAPLNITPSASPPPAGPPIRDDYAPVARSKPTTTARNGGDIVWSEPSMPSKGKVGKSNISVSGARPCREFQQDIVIDGQKQKAHGRACQQSDGSWRIEN